MDINTPNGIPELHNSNDMALLLGKAIGKIEAIDEKFDTYYKETNEKFDKIDVRFDKMDAKLEEHSQCLEPLRFSRCKLIPWLGRNRWFVMGFFALVTAYLSTINFVSDWVSRSLQWGFFPPKIGGP